MDISIRSLGLFGLSVFGLFAALSCANAAAAAEASPSAPSASDLAVNVDPAKKAAIRELLTITKMSENAASVQDLMLNMARRSIDMQLQRKIQADTTSSDSQKTELQAALSDDGDRIIDRYRKLFQERINLSDLMERVGYKVYDESFTTAEINDLIAFYRTATGQKAMKELPGIMKRSMTLTADLVTPKVVEILKEISSEELDHLKHGAFSKSSAPISK